MRRCQRSGGDRHGSHEGRRAGRGRLVHSAGLLVRARKFGKLTGKNRLIEPAKVAAHHPRLLRSMGQMEGGLEAAGLVPTELKRLASLQAARLIGCPF